VNVNYELTTIFHCLHNCLGNIEFALKAGLPYGNLITLTAKPSLTKKKLAFLLLSVMMFQVQLTLVGLKYTDGGNNSAFLLRHNDLALQGQLICNSLNR